MSNEEFKKSENEKITNDGTDIAYNEFANRSIELLENNIHILNKYFNLKGPMSKFLNIHKTRTFLKYEKSFEDCKKEMLSLLTRLKKNDFEVIFVGAEKSGKSSLINNWLKSNILPTGTGRCTYTSIEILPIDENEKEQVIVTSYFNEKEFDEIIKINQDLLDKCSSITDSNYTALEAEKNELEKCRNDSNFCQLLRKSKEENKFPKSDANAVKKFLAEKIVNANYARALKSITFYTHLFSTKNVLIYDMPGFDSPTKIHTDLAIKRCQSADVIVYVKDLVKPSLPLHEIVILNTFQKIDQLIPFEEKLILAQTCVDRINNINDYFECLKISENEWKKYKLNYKERVSMISNEFENNKVKLKDFNLIESGIDKLEMLINECKYSSRLKILKKKVLTADVNFKQLMKEFLKFSENDFPFDNEMITSSVNKNKSIETKQEDDKALWWNREWKRISESVSKFFKNLCSIDNENFVAFRIKYEETVDLIFADIKEKHFGDAMESLYYGEVETGGIFPSAERHSAVRKHLVQKVYDNLTLVLSVELGQKMWETVSKILNWIFQELYCIKEVKEQLLQNTEENAQRIIVEQIKTLILRVARPAVELFIRHPRHDARIDCIRRFSHEVLILDMFFHKNNKFEPQGLEWFLLTGKFNRNDDYHNSSLSLDVDKLKEKALDEYKNCCKITKDFEEAKEQIKCDFDAYQEYMKNSVYFCSGLEPFFQSELDKFKRRFFMEENDADKWRIRVFEEINNGNPNIPYTQHKLEVKEKLEISKSLNEIKKILT